MDDKIVTLSIGGGGRQTANFIKDIILKYFDNDILNNLGDSSHIETSTNSAFTTDSFVIRPEFFSGGDIGKLSICGTVNDLAVSGAEPLYISFALVVAEGYSYEKLEKIVQSAAHEAKKAGVKVVCGDTKVVERGGIDGVIINTCGLGKVIKNLNDFSAVKAGDKVIVTSDIARHGMAVMLERGQFGFAGNIESDCACLNNMMKAVYPYNIKFGRDATRGGLAAVLNEIAEQSGKGFLIDEEKIPLRQDVAELCDTLGFDPLSVANEGAAVIICGADDCEKVLAVLKSVKEGERAAVIGEVTGDNKVILKTISGGKRHIDSPPGELYLEFVKAVKNIMNIIIDFEKGAGLVPVIVQDADTKEVLMQAYADKEALELTLKEGYAYYYSRSRKSLWKKGETSGHLQKIVKVMVDCDEDCLLYIVHQAGAACHTGEKSCFFRELIK